MSNSYLPQASNIKLYQAGIYLKIIIVIIKIIMKPKKETLRLKLFDG